jgi:hypothetical protein
MIVKNTIAANDRLLKRVNETLAIGLVWFGFLFKFDYSKSLKNVGFVSGGIEYISG